MSKKRYLQTGWTITGELGIYYDSFSRTKKDAINGHCAALGKSWRYCRRKGDRVIRTALVERS